MEVQDYPRVMIVSHNSFSAINNNGKTFSSLFEGWPCEKIAQLYFYSENPDLSVCTNFFRITDGDVIGTMLHPNRSCGGKINLLQTINTDNKESNTLLKAIVRYKNDLFMLLRDAIWQLGKIKSNNLINWIDKFDPELIFFVGSESRFSYDIAFWIAENKKIPFYLYCTDDYISSKWSLNPFFWIKLLGIRKRFCHAVNISKKIFAIGEEMITEYSAKYGGVYQVLTNGITVHSNTKLETIKNNQLVLTYVGNIGLERWKPLSEIGRCLMQLSSLGLIGELRIYTQRPPNKKILKALTLPPFMQHCGSLDSNGVQRVIQDADIVVHAESFSRKAIHITRLSISAKIPEYLAYGKCILAHGPEAVASIRYLKNYGAATVSNNKIDLYDNIKSLFENPGARTELEKRAYELALEKHTRINLNTVLLK